MSSYGAILNFACAAQNHTVTYDWLIFRTEIFDLGGKSPKSCTLELLLYSSCASVSYSMDEALLHEETTMSFVDLPSELIRTENFEHLVQFLQSMQPGQKIRIQTKYKKLTEEWKMATAIREKNSFTIQYDGRSNCDLTYDDADEEHSLISVNNWEIGWYGIVKEMCAASPKEQQDSSGMEHRWWG